MNLYSLAKDKVLAALEGLIPADMDTAKVSVDAPRDASHGDLATNAAMVLAKPSGQNPAS